MEKKEKDIKNSDKEYFLIEESEMSQVSPSLPLNPSPDVIKEGLSRIPAQLEYLEGLELAKKAKLRDVKTYYKAKSKALDIAKSNVRQTEINRWKEDMKEYLPNIKKMFKDFEDDPNMNKIMMQQLIKDLKPEKPTKNDLDDYANLRTEELQRELYNLEKEMNALESECEAIRIKINSYENKYISVRAHIRMLEKQYDRM